MAVPRVRAVSRAIELLSLIGARRRSLTLKDFIAGSGLPKTTVVRLLAELTDAGLISYNGRGSYTVGAALLRWAHLADEVWDVTDRVKGLMQDLVDNYGETLNIFVRQDLARVSIAQVEGQHTLREVVEVGQRIPLGAGAGAEILLAGDPDVIDTLHAAHPELDPEALRARAAAVRERGYAETINARNSGAAALAAPLHAQDGRIIAALSLSGPATRFTSEERALALPALLDTARHIDSVGLGPVEGLL